MPTLQPEGISTVPPICTVPVELIAKIFWHCLPYKVEALPNKAPLLLGQISSWWRDIALSTPTLWKEICLLEHCSQGVALLLPVWLLRAGECALTIDIRWWEHSNWDEDTIAVCNAIQPFAYRVECLRLSLTTEHILHLPILRGRLPSLKEICLSRIPTALDPLPQDITVFTEAPALAIVDMDATCVIPVPWTQLKEIRLSNFTAEACLLHMRQAVNLTHCTLSFTKPSGQNILALPPLHSLVSFSMDGSPRKDPGSFADTGIMFAALTVPALKELSVTIHANDIGDFIRFLDRNAPRLRTMRIHTDLAEESVFQCLRHPSASLLDSLVLVFEEAFPTPTILHSIENPEFLPNLQTLWIIESYRHVPPTPPYDELLLRVLSSRRASHAHFRTFFLRTRHLFKEPDGAKLRDLVMDGGMSIKIRREVGAMDRDTLQYCKAEPMWTLGGF
ncbi:hypothetical protein DFH06DRAFT_1293703 [Mycena polygramma]|nr:hypothetical protein DFH06DRAFT_1293703 [Mycena polygramma]